MLTSILMLPSGLTNFSHLLRGFTKISKCQVFGTTGSRREIVQLGSSFGSIILLFSTNVARADAHSTRGEIPSSRLLLTALHSEGKFVSLSTNVGVIVKTVVSSGATNDGFLLSTLKTLFRLSRVLLDI